MKKNSRTARLPWLWRIPLLPLITFEFFVLVGLIDLTPNFTELGLFSTALIILIGIELLHRLAPSRYKYRLYWWAILPAVVSVYLDAIGDFAHLYSKFPQYDTVLHATGAFSATLFLWGIIHAKYRLSCPPAALFLLVLCAGVTLGAAYEVMEFSEDVLTGSSRLGDGYDTATDLLMDFVGAGAATLLAFSISKKKTGE